jgi:hypothetical protein
MAKKSVELGHLLDLAEGVRDEVVAEESDAEAQQGLSALLSKGLGSILRA